MLGVFRALLQQQQQQWCGDGALSAGWASLNTNATNEYEPQLCTAAGPWQRLLPWVSPVGCAALSLNAGVSCAPGHWLLRCDIYGGMPLAEFRIGWRHSGQLVLLRGALACEITSFITSFEVAGV
jgi:hypothetical protein